MSAVFSAELCIKRVFAGNLKIFLHLQHISFSLEICFAYAPDDCPKVEENLQYALSFWTDCVCFLFFFGLLLIMNTEEKKGRNNGTHEI